MEKKTTPGPGDFVHPAETRKKTETVPETKPQEARPDDWLCFMCLNTITNDKDRFPYDSQSEFTFRNPDGECFNIITFAEASGYILVSAPTTEFTWFPGHAWTICLCDKCGLQVGWKYTGKFNFYGLIRAHLIRGSSVSN